MSIYYYNTKDAECPILNRDKYFAFVSPKISLKLRAWADSMR